MVPARHTMSGSITDVPGIEVGHAQHPSGMTGCSVYVIPAAHAVFLSGGSAYGLDCATGIMSFLEEQKIGFDVGVTVVPIVAGAVLNDLGFTRRQGAP